MTSSGHGSCLDGVVGRELGRDEPVVEARRVVALAARRAEAGGGRGPAGAGVGARGRRGRWRSRGHLVERRQLVEVGLDGPVDEQVHRDVALAGGAAEAIVEGVGQTHGRRHARLVDDAGSGHPMTVPRGTDSVVDTARTNARKRAPVSRDPIDLRSWTAPSLRGDSANPESAELRALAATSSRRSGSTTGSGAELSRRERPIGASRSSPARARGPRSSTRRASRRWRRRRRSWPRGTRARPRGSAS